MLRDRLLMQVRRAPREKRRAEPKEYKEQKTGPHREKLTTVHLDFRLTGHFCEEEHAQEMCDSSSRGLVALN